MELEITVREEERVKKYKVRMNCSSKIVCFFEGQLLELERGRKTLFYHHFKKHSYVPLISKRGKVLDLIELNGIIIDFEKNHIYEFHYYNDDRIEGEGYRIRHPNFNAITFYSLDYIIPPIKVLWIKKAYKI